jgi:hypothetical protein
MDASELTQEYGAIRQQAIRLAGRPEDIAHRAAVHHGIFLDSRGNHTFPQIALHGALWASGFFETGGRVGTLIGYRYFYSEPERRLRMAMLERFAAGFKRVNRAVFIDTYTNYHFSRRFGRERDAGRFVQPELLDALNGVHAATAAGTRLGAAAKRSLYERALLWEQEVTVAPGVAEEIATFTCPILAAICLKPIVRFAYFPRGAYLFFKDFADRHERIEKAMRSYDLAERAGWGRVVATMRAYGVLPPAFFQAPDQYTGQLLRRLDAVAAA